MSADLFHMGHVIFLSKIKDYFIGDSIEITIALHTDEQIFSFKGRYPVQSFQSRKIVLEACRYVDMVLTAPDEYTEEFAGQFDFLVHGDDLLGWDPKIIDKYYRFFIQKQKLILVSYTKEISTTQLISLAKQADFIHELPR